MMFNRQSFALAAAAVTLASLFAAPAAEARRKEVFVQEYSFAKPMHGFSGHSGSYYCDYQRVPKRACTYDRNGGESCRIVGWTLRQMCQ